MFKSPAPFCICAATMFFTLVSNVSPVALLAFKLTVATPVANAMSKVMSLVEVSKLEIESVSILFNVNAESVIAPACVPDIERVKTSVPAPALMLSPGLSVVPSVAPRLVPITALNASLPVVPFKLSAPVVSVKVWPETAVFKITALAASTEAAAEVTPFKAAVAPATVPFCSP